MVTKPTRAAFLGTISLLRYLALAIAAAAVDANLFVPKAMCGGSPAARIAGRRSSPPPPTALSTNPAKTPTSIRSTNTSLSTGPSKAFGLSLLSRRDAGSPSYPGSPQLVGLTVIPASSIIATDIAKSFSQRSGISMSAG